MDRRTYLALAGGSALALAGCLGSEDDGDPDENESDPNGNGNGNGDATNVGEAFVEDMAASEYERAFDRFDRSLQPSTSVGQIEGIWLAATNVGGDFERIDETTETVQSGFDATDLALAFERSDHTLRVVTGDSNRIRSVFFNDDYARPDYVAPEAFERFEVDVTTEDCLLGGTITRPDVESTVPGVVLVHGSDPGGRADRNLRTVQEQLGPDKGSKPFKDLAEGLASQGVAVLRYDRRTHACSGTLTPAEHTLDRVCVDDALTAIETLRGTDGVDGDRIAVAGLSLGGLAVPRIAERDGNLLGAIGLAAPARSFHELFVEQFQYLATVGEHDWEQMAAAAQTWEDRIDRIREGDYDASDMVLGYPGALWDSLDAYDHVETARSVETPLRFLQGGRDYQVSPEADFGLWQSELADRPDTTFELFEDLNHLFQFGSGPSVPIEYTLQNPVDRVVVDDIATWVDGL